MTVTVPLRALELTPGSCVSIDGLSWQNYENLLTEWGERRRVRVAYYRGKLEIVSPLPLHERPHRIIATIVTTILEIQGRDWEDFGSTTFKRGNIAGVEPDTCLYIENATRVRGCTRMDLDVYPPPDLAIESDVTSKTTLDAYVEIGVPEVWVYGEERLKIHVLDDGAYREVAASPTFPDLDASEMIPRLVREAIDFGTRAMLRGLRERLEESPGRS
jgi:Uma2 family endonuclease